MISKNIIKKAIASVAILCVNLTAFAYSPTYYTSNSKMNQGRWVKIKVSEIGMQEITHEQLAQMGFEDPSKVCVYGYGGASLTSNKYEMDLPDDLPPQPVYYAKDKIIFYGEPDLRVNLGSSSSQVDVLRNVYSNAGYYLLSDSEPGVSSVYNEASLNSSNVLSREYHNSIAFIENEVENPGKAGAIFFDKSLIENPNQKYSFTCPKPYNPQDEPANFRYVFAAKAPSYMALKVACSHPESVVSSNHRAVIPSSLASQYYYTNEGEVDFNMNTTDEVYSFTFSLPNVTATYAAVDYAYVSYRRQNDLEGLSQLRMSFLQVNQNTNFKINNATENTVVWNVTSSTDVYPHKTSFSAADNTLIGSFDKTYTYASTDNACLIAFDPTRKLHQVEFVKELTNQNLHSEETPDMLIITNELCLPYAERLAQAHRDYQGMNVIVTLQDKIFNEFSSGTPSAMAYRRYLKMFYDRNPEKIKYLLLFGEGSWDNRGVMYPKEGRLLTYQAEEVEDARSAAKSFCGDSYFAMVNNDYDPDYFFNNDAQIAVGRIPASTEADALAVTNKTIRYLMNPPSSSVFNRALIVADEGDSFGHLIQQETNADSIAMISPATTCTRVYNVLYPSTQYDAAEAREMIIQSLNQGQGFFSYAGHGGATAFTGKKLWSIASTKETSYSYSPIAMYATCDAFSFDRGDGGMAESALYKEDGGFIAIVAASRTVYMQFNQYINNAFTTELYRASEGDLIGDVYLRARNKAAKILPDRALGVNTMCYNLAGDPALPLYKPSLNIATASINDVQPQDGKYLSIAPLSKNIVKGYVCDEKGNALSSFNGTITLSLYDAPTVFTINETKSGSTSTITKTSGNITNNNGVIEFNGAVTSLDSIKYYNSNEVRFISDEYLLAEVTTSVVNGAFTATIVPPVPLKGNSVNRMTYYAVSSEDGRRASGNIDNISVSNYNKATADTDTEAPVVEECYINTPSFNNGDIVGSDFILYAKILADESGINTSTGTIGATTTLTLDGNKTFPEIRTTLMSDASGNYTLSFPLNGIEDGQHTLTLSVADNAGNRNNHSVSFIVINSSADATLAVEESPARTEATFELEHNFSEEPAGRLVVENSNGNTVYTKEDCTFPYTWNLKDNNDALVPDGKYKAYVILNGGKQYGSTAKIEIIVVK